jgi:uncharacterized protein (TIGR00299 family) protein
MKTLYLDIFSGISGDMFIGAMLDLGVPFEQLEHALASLRLDHYHAHATRQHKASIEGVKFDVHCHDHEDHHHEHEDRHEHEHAHGHDHKHDDHHHSHEHGRTFSEIRELISHSHLSPWVKEKSVAVFARIARAEGKIHGQPPDEVHFHEVGAVDSIVDIVGACVCLELLGRPRVLAAPVFDGAGWINCAHGRFPIPAPATLAILAERGVSITQCEEPHELVTPTGAAILAEFVEEFGPLRAFAPERIGHGLGQRDNKTRPNVLRAILGSSQTTPSAHDWETDTVAVLETNLDDISPEVLGYVVEKALAEGALDVFHTSIQMKKNRPGVLLTILCAAADQDRFTELLLRQTTALGVRRSTAERRKLQREIVTVQTPFGPVQMKLGKLDGQTLHASPEFESCKTLAGQHRVPIQQIYQAAIAALKTP